MNTANFTVQFIVQSSTLCLYIQVVPVCSLERGDCTAPSKTGPEEKYIEHSTANFTVQCIVQSSKTCLHIQVVPVCTLERGDGTQPGQARPQGSPCTAA